MEELDISTNWVCETDYNLSNLVTFIESDNNEGGFDCVTPESCICLNQNENENLNCKPEIKLKVKYVIREVNVFSEASLIEIFGTNDEYLTTCIAEFVDDWEGMAVYHAKIVLPYICNCRLKFSRFKEKDRLWIYSIQLSVSKTPAHLEGSLFNFENVNQLISDSNQQISEKAEKFKNFFEVYAKNPSRNQSFSMQTLLKTLNSEFKISDPRTMSRLLSSNEGLGNRKETEESVECQNLKSYIDRRLIDLREDLMKNIEIKLSEIRSETNAKLDRIIKLLESSKV